MGVRASSGSLRHLQQRGEIGRDHLLGVSQLQFGHRRYSDALTRSRIRRSSFTRRSRRCGKGSYRALASTANHFARESHIDELAHAIGMHPVEFR